MKLTNKKGFNLGLMWYPITFLIMIFSWTNSHLQLFYFLTKEVSFYLNEITVIIVISMAFSSILLKYKKSLLLEMGFFLGIIVFYSILFEIIRPEKKLIYLLHASAVLIAILPVILNKQALFSLVKITYLFGLILIIFSSVPILHEFKLIELENEQVIRVAGEKFLRHLDPINFGIFGLTENYTYPSHPFNLARLQGFSLEPIHWVYFVLLTLTNGLILLSQKSNNKSYIIFFMAFTVILIHILFVFSLTGFIVITSWFLLMMIIYLSHFFFNMNVKIIRKFIFFGIVIFPGLILPSILFLIPDLLSNTETSNFLGKQGNWESKIGFVDYNLDRFISILPRFENTSLIGHNLIFEVYFQFGLILLVPLLTFLWFFIKSTIVNSSLPFIGAVSLALLNHLFVVPTQFFWASGVLTFTTLIGVAIQNRNLLKVK